MCQIKTVRMIIHVFPDDELLNDCMTWKHGAMVEFRHSENGMCLHFRRAEKGEPGLKLRHGRDGLYFRFLPPISAPVTHIMENSNLH
jgi:hypothetical protein